MLTLPQFIDKYTGKKVEYHSYSANAENQCVDLANAYITEVLGLPAIIGTNAQDFPSKKGESFDWIANTPTGLPSEGDLMIFKSADGVGHISIYLEGDLRLFRSFDQNYPTGSPCKIVQHSYVPNVLGWLRAKAPPTVGLLKGIDISRHQGEITFNLVKDNVSFVLIKASEGTGFTDPKFYQNINEARRVGLLTGAYHFARPDLNNTALEEADWFLTVYKPLPGELLVLDYEPNWGGDAVRWCKTFLDRVTEKTSCKPLIYLNRSQTTSFNWTPVIDAGYRLWLASYDSNPSSVPSTIWPKVTIKQYSNAGSVPGIAGNVDLNSYFGTNSSYTTIGYKGDSMLTQNELDACMVDRAKFWQERDAALAKITVLENQLADKDSALSAKDATIAELEIKLAEALSTPPAEDTEWIANGKAVTTVVGDTSTTINYAKK